MCNEHIVIAGREPTGSPADRGIIAARCVVAQRVMANTDVTYSRLVAYKREESRRRVRHATRVEIECTKTRGGVVATRGIREKRVHADRDIGLARVIEQ